MHKINVKFNKYYKVHIHVTTTCSKLGYSCQAISILCSPLNHKSVSLQEAMAGRLQSSLPYFSLYACLLCDHSHTVSVAFPISEAYINEITQCVLLSVWVFSHKGTVCPYDLSISWHVAVVCSFPLSCRVLLCEYTTGSSALDGWALASSSVRGSYEQT